MGKAQRTKGHSFERKTAEDMRRVGFSEARRQLEYHKDDAQGVDLQNTGVFDVQCKAMKKQPNVPRVFSEMPVDPERIPVVVYKVDRKGTYATFKWEDAKLLMGAFDVLGANPKDLSDI